MSNKLDKLFKDKLEGDSLQPSTQAWEKVEAHLAKKNKMVVWLRVAAAVALLGALTFVALNWNNSYEEPKKELVKKEEPDVRSKEQVVEKKEPVIPGKKKTKKSKAQPKVVAPFMEQPAEEPIEEIAIVNEPAVTPQLEIKKEKGITLTYSLPAIKKPEAAEEPAVAEAKKTGLERVLEIAKEVKNGDNPLGELREAKDNILAWEFRKDKDKKKE